jgi:SAM-dependent methyltransferase
MSAARTQEREAQQPAFPGWCCSYCADPLRPAGHGLYCAGEGRYFATHHGVHRLLPEERHRELRAFLELYQRVRRDEGWRASPGLPDVPAGHPHARVWRRRAASLAAGLQAVEAALPPQPWRVLEVGAGCCWISAQLVLRGHQVAAVDVNLDPEDGLPAADALALAPLAIERAEAEMEALPLEPQSFDLVVAGASLHYPASLPRTLVELRRVTRRGGALLVLDSPVYRRRADGEAMVADRMRAQAERYRGGAPRESQSGYLVLPELAQTFERAGWRLSVHGWPPPLRERLRDVVEIARHGRRTARFPVLLARRDG